LLSNLFISNAFVCSCTCTCAGIWEEVAKTSETINVYVHWCTHTHTHMHAHTHTHTHTHTHIHSRTNTRTHNPPLSLSLPPTHTKVHWYGNCNKGNTKEATCCSNAALLKSGFDWTKFSRGNSCSGDKDLDRVLDKVPPPMCRERERDL